MCLHKYKKFDEQPKYYWYKCQKCGKLKCVERFIGGYQPKKYKT